MHLKFYVKFYIFRSNKSAYHRSVETMTISIKDYIKFCRFSSAISDHALNIVQMFDVAVKIILHLLKYNFLRIMSELT